MEVERGSAKETLREGGLGRIWPFAELEEGGWSFGSCLGRPLRSWVLSASSSFSRSSRPRSESLCSSPSESDSGGGGRGLSRLPGVSEYGLLCRALILDPPHSLDLLQ